MTHGIYSRLFEIKLTKEAAIGRKLTLDNLNAETGLAKNTLMGLLDPKKKVERIESKTVFALCRFFEVGFCDLLYMKSDDDENTISGNDSVDNPDAVEEGKAE